MPFAIVRNSGAVTGDHVSVVPWWSVTKTVLAATVLRLTELAAFRLDDVYEDWPFTIRQLLQHTAGLTDYGGPAYQRAVTAGDRVWPLEELLTRHNARRLLFPPGNGWAYSNIGYLLLRHVIERTTSMDLDGALKQLVLAPLCLSTTRVATSPEDLQSTYWGNSTNYDPRWVFHGLLIGAPRDAVIFLDGLLAGGLLSEASLAAMQSVRTLGGALPGRPWTQGGYGLGLMIGTMHDAGRAIGHSGVGHDSVSALYAFPDLPGRPVIATFARGTDEGISEREAVRLALAM